MVRVVTVNPGPLWASPAWVLACGVLHMSSAGWGGLGPGQRHRAWPHTEEGQAFGEPACAGALLRNPCRGAGGGPSPRPAPQPHLPAERPRVHFQASSQGSGKDGPWGGRGCSPISELGGFCTPTPGPQPQRQRHRPLEPTPRQAPESSRPGSAMAPGVCASKTLSFLSPGSCRMPRVPRLVSSSWPQSCGACQGPAGTSPMDCLSCPHPRAPCGSGSLGCLSS